VAVGVAQRAPSLVFDSARISGEDFRLELTVPEGPVTPPRAETAAERAPQKALPEPTWRTSRKSRELRERIAHADRKLEELARVLGEVDAINARREALKVALIRREGWDRAAQAAILLQRTVGAGQLEEVTFRFSKDALVADVARGEGLEAVVAQLQDESVQVKHTGGAPSRLELRRR
jgi:hypothetical protein